MFSIWKVNTFYANKCKTFFERTTTSGQGVNAMKTGFCFRIYRFTVTVAEKLLLSDTSISNELGLSNSAPNRISTTEWMHKLCDGWLSQRRSTVALKRDISKENSVREDILTMAFIDRIDELRLMVKKKEMWPGLICGWNRTVGRPVHGFEPIKTSLNPFFSDLV